MEKQHRVGKLRLEQQLHGFRYPGCSYLIHLPSLAHRPHGGRELAQFWPSQACPSQQEGEKKKKKKRRRRRRKGREMTYPIPLRKHSRRPPGLFNPQLEFSPRPHLTAMEVGEGKLLNHWDQCGLFYYFSFQENLQEGVTTAPQVCFWVCILNKTQSSQEDSHSSELSVFLNSIPLPTLYIIIHILRKGTRVKISRDRGSASLFLWQLLLYFFGGKKKLLR